MEKKEKGKHRIRFPIRLKTTIMVIIFALVLVEIAMTFFSISNSNENKKTYTSTATNLAATISRTIDAGKVNRLQIKVHDIVENSSKKPTTDEWGSDDWNAYSEQFKPLLEDQDFKDLRAFLKGIESVNVAEVSSIYCAYIDPKLKSYVYLVDSADGEDMWLPGVIDALNEEHLSAIENPKEPLPAVITNYESFGWLCTAGSPIEYEGKVVAYSLVDLSMEVIRNNQAGKIIRLFAYLMSAVAVLAIISIIVVHFALNRPLKRLTIATKSYDANRPAETHEAFAKLKIKTRDELEDLAEAMKQFEHDIFTTTHALKESEEVASKMTKFANKDGLTGVRNKVSYNNFQDSLNAEINAKTVSNFGIAMIDLNYLKQINDDYGHASGDEAIIKLSNLICAVFAHSPVFRVGGDEFVVVLQSVDYERSEQLIDEFNAKIEKLSSDEHLPPAQRIGAALGYAEFNPEKDTCVDDVFKRADYAMYRRKREMKNS